MERTGRTVSSRRFFLPRKRASGMHRLSYTFTIHILRACIMHQLPKGKPRRKGYDLFCVQSSGESYSTTTEQKSVCVCVFCHPHCCSVISCFTALLFF